jgi:glycerol-3-phosphate acyltransferase PlsY
MMDLWTSILVALGGYLIGSISFTRIIGSRVAPDEDLSHTEVHFGEEGKSFTMKTVSATSLTFRKGPKVGCLTSLLDMIKAILPTLVIKLYYPEQAYFLIVAAATMAGHNFPIYYGFKGGRGMSTLYGGLLVIDWLSIPITAIGGALFGGLILRDMFFTYTVGIILLMPWLWYRFESVPYLLYGVVVNLLFWIAMIPEIRDYIEKKRAGLTEEVNFKKYWQLASSMWLKRRTDQVEVDSEESVLQ